MSSANSQINENLQPTAGDVAPITELQDDAEFEPVVCAPYLLRLLLTDPAGTDAVAEARLFSLLIGHIVWPKDAMKRVRAAFTSVEDDCGTGGGDLPTWLSAGRRHIRIVRRAETADRRATMQAVDVTLCDHPLSYDAALITLRSCAPDWMRGVLTASLAAAEQQRDAAEAVTLARLQKLATWFDWSPAQCMVARLVWHATQFEWCYRLLDELAHAANDAGRAYSTVLPLDRRVLRDCLAAKGPLYQSGLVRFHYQFGNGPFPGFSDPPALHPALRPLLATSTGEFTLAKLTAALYHASPVPTLDDADFQHLRADADALIRFLRQSASASETGINILIYGPPGTGKTEFARWLLQAAGLHGYEVPVQVRDEDVPSTDPVADRLGSARSSQQLLRGKDRAVLVFDEAEDAFPQALSFFGFEFAPGKRHASGPRKGWINQLLESTPVPIIWISNAISQIDPAYLRRFSFHLEMRRPSQRIRERIAARQATAQGVAEAVVAPLARYADASPAAIASALRFARLASDTSNGTGDALAAQQQRLAERNLQASLAAAGLRDHVDARLAAMPYDPTLINIAGSVQPDALLALMRCGLPLSLCLYGAPGTGKTSFAEYVAEQLDKPLLYRRASDLQSKWVGETERNLRDMFAEARADNAVLLLDEADSFLYDRRHAERSWERSQVNELLQGMERFDGIFIAATNLIDVIDKAAVRRFAYKLEFLPLTAAQCRRMLLTLVADPDEWQEQCTIGPLEGFTLGDFASVARTIRYAESDASLVDVLERLRGEAKMRGGGLGRRMGF